MLFLSFVLVCVLLFFGGMLVGMSGGGAGMLMAAVGALFLQPQESIAFAATIMFIAQTSSVLQLHRYIRWDVVAHYAPSGMLGGIVGAVLLFWIPGNIPKIILGIACITFTILRVSGWRTPSPRGSGVWIVGFLNGIIAGITRGGSMLRSSFLLSLELSPKVFVSTSSAIAMFQLAAQICVYSVRIQWTQSLILGIAGGIAIVPLGVWVGQKILKKISREVFERMQLFIIFFSGLYLLISSFR